MQMMLPGQVAHAIQTAQTAQTPQAAQPALEPRAVASRLGEAYRLGSGDTVLLLIPCASCRWRSFDEFMQRNAERYTMYAVTLPGYGGTRPPDLPHYATSTLWHDNAAAALIALLEDEGVSRAVVVGSSFGSTIGLLLAHRRPDLVAGLVNIDGFPTNGPEVAEQNLGERLEQARQIMHQYAEPLVQPDRWQRFNTPSIIARPERKLLYHGWFMATDREAMIQYWWENMLEDRNPWLRELEGPYLDIRALRPWDEQPEETRRQAEETMAQIGTPSGYQRVFLYETPHFVMEERPELLDRLIADFVAGRPLQDFRPNSR